MEKNIVLEVKENAISRNDEEAKEVRRLLKEKNIYFINLMASPGSGKTTLLMNLIPYLTDKGYRAGVMEADIDGDVDCSRIKENTKAKAIQIHTMGACHLTAQMTKESLSGLDTDELDIVFLENIGNLVCPAEFDTGSDLNLMLLSVPEGDDKPLKYPLMFKVSQICCITKCDVLPLFDFSKEKVEERIHCLNPNSDVRFISSRKNEGIRELADILIKKIEDKKGVKP